MSLTKKLIQELSTMINYCQNNELELLIENIHTMLSYFQESIYIISEEEKRDFEKVIQFIIMKASENNPNKIKETDLVFILFKTLLYFTVQSDNIFIKEPTLTWVELYLASKEHNTSILKNEKEEINKEDKGIGHAVIDVNGKFLWADATSCWLFETRNEKLIQMKFTDLITEISLTYFYNKYNGVLMNIEKQEFKKVITYTIKRNFKCVLLSNPEKNIKVLTTKLTVIKIREDSFAIYLQTRLAMPHRVEVFLPKKTPIDSGFNFA